MKSGETNPSNALSALPVLAVRMMSLHDRIVWMLIVALLPVFGFVVVASVSHQDDKLTQVRSDLRTLAQLSSLSTERQVEGARQLLGVTTSGMSLNVAGARALCSDFLNNVRKNYPNYANIGFLDADGKLLCDALSTQSGGSFADRAYFQRAIATRSFAVGNYQIGRITGRPSLNFGLSVLDSQGAVRGVAFAALDIRHLSPDEQIVVPPNTRVTLTDHDGTILATDAAQSSRIGSRYPDAALYSAMKTPPAGVIQAKDTHGASRLYAIAPVGAGNQPGLFVVTSVALDEVVAPARRELLGLLVLFSLWALLGVAFARLMGYKMLVAPAQQLLGDMDQLAARQGLLASAAGTTPVRVDEIGALSRAFHRLAARLALRQAERDGHEAELRLTQDRLLTAQRIGNIGNWEFDVATHTLWWSEQTYAIFEKSPASFSVRLSTLSEQIFPEDRARCEEMRRDFFASKTSLDIEHRIVTGTGRVRWVHEMGEMRVDNQGRTVLYGTVQDITDRVRNERLLAAEARALKALSLGWPLAAVLQETLLGLESILPGAMTCVNLLSADGTRLLPGAAPNLPAAYVEALDGVLIGPAVGSCGTSAYRREVVVVPDIASDPLWDNYRALALQHGLRACWSLPVQDPMAKVLATFAVYYRSPTTPHADDLALVQRAASVVGIALAREMKDAALRASEERFRNTFAAAATGMTITCLAGQYLEVNDAYCRMLGYTAQELLGANVFDFIHSDDKHSFSDQMHELAAGRLDSYISERRFLARGARVVWVRSSVSSLRDATGQVIARAAIAEDITRQRQAEQSLLDTQHLLSMASRISRQGAWRVSLPDNQVIWSEEVFAIHELPAGPTPSVDEAIGFYTPESQGTLRTLFQNCASQGVPYDVELQLITGKGRQIWTRALAEAVRDASGTIVAVQGAFQDITQKRVAAEQLLLLETAVSHLNDIVMITQVGALEDSELKIVFVNEAFERQTGYSKDEAMGQPLRALYDPHTQRTEIDRIYVAVGTRQSACTELIKNNKHGDAYWVEVETVPITNAQGKLTHYVAIERDISERKQAVENILQLNADLEGRVQRRTQQLEAANRELEAFSYSVSHDLRSPLNTIHGFVQLLLKSNERNLDVKGLHYLSRIRAGAQQMGNMIDGLLSLAKISREPLRLEAVDLSLMVRQIEQACRMREPGRQVRVVVQDGVVVQADALLLSVVVQNLFENAWKYSAKRDVASINVTRQTQADGQVVCAFEDNGAGFDMAQADKLFGMFERLHSSADFEGTGLGLANVRRIVERHGGRIWAQGVPGEGATFYFTLPSATQA
ncbi:MAG: PAS domain S-box protein [Polaromonas sp.]|nr:MAG: PAS domain S-box protein [Polaromonas sp.]